MAGSILRVGNRFRVTKELGKDNNGKRLREYIFASTESEAKKLLSEFEYIQQRNLLVQSNIMTLGEFMEYFMSNYVKYNCEETTAYGYRNIINNHITPYIGNVELQKLQPMHIQQYYKHLMDEKGLSPNTVIKHHANIRKALDFALKNLLVYRNVADAVTLPRKIKFEADSYTKEQLYDLLEKVKDTKLELPVYLAGYLGLRRSEICGVKWKNIDLEDRVLYVKEVRTTAGNKVITKMPKSIKSKRALFIEDELFEILLKCKARQIEFKQLLGNEYENSDYVYTQENGKLYRVNSVTEQFKEFLKKNQLPPLVLHGLRHTFASILFDEGVSVIEISEALGHSDPGTTNSIYIHKLDKINKNAVSMLSKALRK